MTEYEKLTLAAGQAYIGVPGFARTVDRAAHHRDLDRTVICLEASFDFLGHRLQIYFRSAAGRAAYQLRSPVTQAQ